MKINSVVVMNHKSKKHDFPLFSVILSYMFLLGFYLTLVPVVYGSSL